MSKRDDVTTATADALGASPPPRSALIVEDDPTAALLLRQSLQATGVSDADIHVASTLRGALELLDGTVTPDVIVLDLGLPDSSGHDTVRQVRTSHPDLPVVVVSARDGLDAATTSLREGADDYLVKGEYEQEQLDRALRYARERRRVWSDARRREAEVERAERRLRQIVEANVDGMVIVDPEGVVLFSNQRAEEMLGRPDESLVGATLGVPVGVRGPVDVETVAAPEGWKRLEMRTTRLDWEGVAAHLVVLRDVTDHRRLQDRLRQAQKMEALGQLTGGIAHDFNNVLSVILSGADALGDMVPSQLTEAHRELRDIETSARRAAGMVRRLLGFSRGGYLRFETVDLPLFTREMSTLAGRVFTDSVRIRQEIDDDAGSVRADPASLQQIFLNIVANARDAMPRGGTFTIRVEAVELDDTHRVEHPWMRPGRFTTVSFEDTGEGMSEAVRNRIFEPFFTTKSPDAGTGLGMAMVYGLMKQHRGMVHVESGPGEGTRVKLLFPTAEPTDRPPLPQPAPRTDDREAGETLLVIEDEPALRRGMERILVGAGYTVLLARDGREGLDILDREGHGVDLVLSDLVMPRLGGREVLGELRARGAAQPFVLITGNGLDSVQEFRRQGVVTLAKPWTRRDLLHAVRRALETGPDPSAGDAPAP